MKYINVTIPSTGNITPYELHRAIANREEYLQGYNNIIPTISNQKTKLKIKEGAGLYTFIQGCLP